MCPLLLRPECFLRTSMSDFSGSTLERSEKSIVVTKRRPGLVGRYFFTGILLLEVVHAAQFDFLAGLQSDNSLLEIALLAGSANPAAGKALLLAAHVDGVDVEHIHAEDLFDGMADLRLRRIRVHDERVLRAEGIRHGLLGDTRREDDITCVHYLLPPLAAFSASNAAVVKMIRS